MEGQLRRLILALLIVDYIAVIVHFSQTIQFENEANAAPTRKQCFDALDVLNVHIKAVQEEVHINNPPGL